MRFGSVCSGIESASVAWHPLGWSAAWFAEVDRAASDVLAYRFPSIPNYGDMTKLAGMVRRREIEAPDALVGGTPCQSFSVAGLRGGLSDSRGQLTLAFVDLANAIDEVRLEDGLPPVITIWENVPGALNHADNPLGCLLAALAGDDDALEPGPRPGPGRSAAFWTWNKKTGVHNAKWPNSGAAVGPQRAVAWTVKDAQYFGLAQRRRRVFVVASARQGFDPSTILLEFDGVRRDSAPSREAGEGTAGTLASRTTGGGFPGTDEACSGYVQPVIGNGFRGDADVAPVPTWWDGRDVSQTLDAVLYKGQTMPEKNRFPAVLQPIAFTTKDYGGDATENLSPTLRSMGHTDSHANGGGQMGVAYSVSLRGREGGGTAELGDDVAGCLRASGGGGDKPHVLTYAIQERAVCENPNAGPDGKGFRDDGCAYTLEARTVPQAVCVTGSVTHTLRAEGFDASEDGTGRGQPIIAFHPTQDPICSEDGVCHTIGTGSSNGMATAAVLQPTMAVRRLMPVECERLQGFPDGWTDVPNAKGKPAADGPRYKQLGNSMATNVMHWIGRRIKAALPGDNGGPPLEDYESLLL